MSFSIELLRVVLTAEMTKRRSSSPFSAVMRILGLRVTLTPVSAVRENCRGDFV